MIITHISTKKLDENDVNDNDLVKLNLDFLEDFTLIDSSKKTCSGFIYDIGIDSELCCMPKCKFNIYQNNYNYNKNEQSYLDIMNQILKSNNIKSTRNGDVIQNLE